MRKILIGLCCVGALFSCNDEMNYSEYTNYDKEQIFSSFTRTGNFVANIYSYLDYDFGNDLSGAMLASACDEAQYAWASSPVHDFYNGSWGPTNAKSYTWTSCYAAIRAANYYLIESEGQTFDDFKYNKDYYEQMERFERYQYEVRLLRAYFYFSLLRQYGDVPLVTEVLTSEEANSVKRDDVNTVFDFVISECDAVVDELPIAYDTGETSYAETGRVTRATALALKARVLLYRASPLFNADNDESLWLEAAIANQNVIQFCAANGYSLGTYEALWGTDNWSNKEMIFVRRIGNLNWLEGYNFPIGVENGNSGNCPTQTLVDAYEMLDTGKAWSESGSGYDESNPYDGRDPRFYLTVAKNGDTGWPSYYSGALQTYVGGANGSPISGATPTGYYLKKYLDASVDLRSATANSKRHSWITFRLAEFYLNYAEAAAHCLSSPDVVNGKLTITPRSAVNTVRARSGVAMPDFPAGMSNTAFLAKLENERMVELAFEGHRFWDIRRWKKGEVLKSVTLMELTNNNDGTFTYTRVSKSRAWDDKMYFFPIPDSERRKNPNLTQNPGW